MAKRPNLSLQKAVRAWEAMLEVRRELYRDTEFFKVPDAWEKIGEGNEKWTTKTYKAELIDDYKRRAGIVVFDDRVTLVTDERLIEKARRGCWLSNFILAHEISHLALDHHRMDAVVKNFQLFKTSDGMFNVPPTAEELQANYAAVFFQCGQALLDDRLSDVALARKAYSDVEYIKKARRIIRLPSFVEELNRPRPKYERVVL